MATRHKILRATFVAHIYCIWDCTNVGSGLFVFVLAEIGRGVRSNASHRWIWALMGLVELEAFTRANNSGRMSRTGPQAGVLALLVAIQLTAAFAITVDPCEPLQPLKRVRTGFNWHLRMPLQYLGSCLATHGVGTHALHALLAPGRQRRLCRGPRLLAGWHRS